LLFALNLDPDNKTFWTADLSNGNVYHVEIDTGTVIKQFNAGITQSLAGLAVAGEITAATTAPPFTTSYYISTTKSATMANLGRDTALSQLASGGNRDYIVGLLFGAPTLTNGKYGATEFTTSVPVATIAGLVEAFASGYYNNLGNNKTLHLRIVIATSNGTTSVGGNQVTFEHGKAWAQMVGEVSSWVVSQRYVSQVDIAGGSDMEFSDSVRKNGTRMWAPAADTRAWVNGYASVLPQRFLYDVGDAGGCPTSGTTAQPRACTGGWTQEDAWYVSWGADPSQPLPEIYRTDSAQAKQWANLSLYGALRHGGSMIISGALTQLQACQQNGCDASIKNTPVNGWTQLFNQLNADARTAQTLAWSTDIKWAPQ
jgi:hypothetical protein